MPKKMLRLEVTVVVDVDLKKFADTQPSPILDDRSLVNRALDVVSGGILDLVDNNLPHRPGHDASTIVGSGACVRLVEGCDL